MMNRIKTLLAFLSRRWPRVLLGLLVLTVVLGAIARIIAPPTVTVETPRLPVTEPLAGAVEVMFTGDRQLPTRLQLFRGTSFLPSSQLLETISARFNLSRHPQIPRLYSTPDLAVSLSQPEGLDLAEYTNDDVISEVVISLSQAQDLAMAFLAQAGYPTAELKLREDQTRFYMPQGLEGFSETSPATATIIELAYIRTLGEYPTVISSSPTNTLRLRVTSRGILNAAFISLFFTTEPAQEISLLSFDDILGQIRQGNYLILGTIDIIDPSDPNNALTALNLSTKEVEYRFDPTQELFIPFVQFGGTATTQGGETLPIVITTPAVKTAPTP